MSKKHTAPRGCADITAPDIYRWQSVESALCKVLHTYGYQEIRTPIFEDTELFARSMGQSSDVVMKQMLNLAAQRPSENGHPQLSGLSLRPENTASVVRSYIQQGLDRKEALSKLYYIGPMFRGERPQKGRLRQFHQVGVEAIGPNAVSPYLDAEVIALSSDLLRAAGLKDFAVHINTLGSSLDKENLSAWLREQLAPHLADLDAEDRARFDRNVFRVLDSKSPATKKVVKGIDMSKFEFSPDSRSYFDQVLMALESLQISYVVDATLVRGLDYYTHTVFEITSSALGSQDALGAGGRYNRLVSQLGGPDVGAVGFALGLERIMLALGENGFASPQRPEVFVIALDEEILGRAWELTSHVRRAGIRTDMAYQVSSVKSLMRQANKSGAAKVVILGKDELARGVVSLKDMGSGEQEDVPVAQQDFRQLIDILKER